MTDAAPSATVDTTPAPSASVADAAPALSSFFATVSFDTMSTVSSSFATSDDVASDSVGNSDASSDDILLLLDQAMAELDDFEEDSPLKDRDAEENDYSELALAAAFDDDTAWWSM
jgi:hypothetical protein